MPGRGYTSANGYRYGFNGKEKDDEMKGAGNSYDYGARIYDPRIGKWLSLDPMQKTYPGWSPYNYVRGNPILKVDVGGEWDVEVHAYSDRAKFGYAIAIVKDRNGNEVARYTCKVMGSGRDRTATNNDTPGGTYKISDWRGTWVDMKNDCAYGYNDVLRLTYEGGEAETTRQGILFHGGRQTDECDDASWIDEDEPLQNTHGCFRFFDEDMLDIKTITTKLTEDDPLDTPGSVTLTNDLIENSTGNYNTPADAASANGCYGGSGELSNNLMGSKTMEDMKRALSNFKGTSLYDADEAAAKQAETEIKADKSNIKPKS